MKWLGSLFSRADKKRRSRPAHTERTLCFEECEGRVLMAARVMPVGPVVANSPSSHVAPPISRAVAVRAVAAPTPTADMTAYRPQQASGSYLPFAKTAVAEANEENTSLGPGIRINGDDDNGNKIADRNDASVTKENDLIEVTLRASGASYNLERSDTNLRVWTAATKGTGTEIVFTNNRSATLTFPSTGTRTVWVEWVGAAQGQATLSLKSSPGLPQDVLLFHTFHSVVVALGGEDQVPTNPVNSNHGTFQIATRLYGDGFDTAMYDEDNVDANGAGAIYNELVNAIKNRGVTELAIFGYSHGGGSTYDLAERLNNNRAAIGTFAIRFTAYIDGVENDSNYDIDQELRRPLATAYHANYFQRGTSADYWLDGGPIRNSGADFQLDVETTAWGRNATHFVVDDFAEVRNGIYDQLVPRVTR